MFSKTMRIAAGLKALEKGHAHRLTGLRGAQKMSSGTAPDDVALVQGAICGGGGKGTKKQPTVSETYGEGCKAIRKLLQDLRFACTGKNVKMVYSADSDPKDQFKKDKQYMGEVFTAYNEELTEPLRQSQTRDLQKTLELLRPEMRNAPVTQSHKNLVDKLRDMIKNAEEEKLQEEERQRRLKETQITVENVCGSAEDGHETHCNCTLEGRLEAVKTTK